MRFDVDRVVALADSWSGPKWSRAEGDERAAGEVAKHLEQAGLRVERLGTSPSGFWPRVLAVLLAPCLGLAMLCATPTPPLPARLGFVAAIAAPVFFVAWWTERQDRKAEWTMRPEQILGLPARDGGERPTARIVLLARVSPPGLVLQRSLLWFGVATFGFSVAVLRLAWADFRRAPSLGASSLANLSLCASMLLFFQAMRSTRSVPGDRRIGLAMLAELARTWPKSVGDRVETWFAATPNTLALASELVRQPGDRPPTLVIDLAWPEVGAELVISGRGAEARLAGSAARDLWIPHRVSYWHPLLSSFAFRARGLPCVSLRVKRDRRPDNPALLAAMAQLVTELALRWAKQAGTSAQPGSLAMSSQNRG